jgi:hypothetical protein
VVCVTRCLRPLRSHERVLRRPASIADRPRRDLGSVWPSPVCGGSPRHHQTRCEFLALHSITSSAVASSVSGMVRPRAFAVLRLSTRSNFVGTSTGRSLGFTPRRIRLT